MELDIMGLYNLLGKDPDNFVIVLKNLYGYEILALEGALDRATEFIQDEDGKDATRNSFIKSELDDLASEFDKVMLLMAYFRYVRLDDTISSNTIRLRLNDAKEWVVKVRESFSNGVEVDRIMLRDQNLKVYNGLKEDVLATLLMVDKLLRSIDESLKN